MVVQKPNNLNKKKRKTAATRDLDLMEIVDLETPTITIRGPSTPSVSIPNAQNQRVIQPAGSGAGGLKKQITNSKHEITITKQTTPFVEITTNSKKRKPETQQIEITDDEENINFTVQIPIKSTKQTNPSPSAPTTQQQNRGVARVEPPKRVQSQTTVMDIDSDDGISGGGSHFSITISDPEMVRTPPSKKSRGAVSRISPGGIHVDGKKTVTVAPELSLKITTTF